MQNEDNKRMLQQSLVTRVLTADGAALQSQRKEAFENAVEAEPLRALVQKIALTPSRVCGNDIDGVKESGLSEDQIFELVICAAVGQATRQCKSALEALSRAVAGARGSNRET